jgi:hypothetical protein
LSISSPIATGARIASPLFGIRHRLTYIIHLVSGSEVRILLPHVIIRTSEPKGH